MRIKLIAAALVILTTQISAHAETPAPYPEQQKALEEYAKIVTVELRPKSMRGISTAYYVLYLPPTGRAVELLLSTDDLVATLVPPGP